MKKALALVAAVMMMGLLMSLFALPAAADTAELPEGAIPIEGGYVVEVLDEGVEEILAAPFGGRTLMAAATMYTRTASYTRFYYSEAGTAEYSLTSIGTFVYDKVSYVNCTAVSYSHEILYSGWRLYSATTSSGSSSATVNGTFKFRVAFVDISTHFRTVTVTCTYAGVTGGYSA